VEGDALADRDVGPDDRRRVQAGVGHEPGRTSTKPAAAKSPSNASASRMRNLRMSAKLVASTKE
jgi:hypothetical protein